MQRSSASSSILRVSIKATAIEMSSVRVARRDNWETTQGECWYIHTFEHPYIHTHTHTYVRISIHTYTHTYTLNVSWSCTYTRTYILHTYVLIHLLAKRHTGIHTSRRTHTCLQYMHVHIHTHTDDKRPLRCSSTMMEAKHWPSRKGETRRSRSNSLDSCTISTNKLTLDASSSPDLMPCPSCDIKSMWLRWSAIIEFSNRTQVSSNREQ